MASNNAGQMGKFNGYKCVPSSSPKSGDVAGIQACRVRSILASIRRPILVLKTSLQDGWMEDDEYLFLSITPSSKSLK